jgi:septum site-determining protein MinC
MPDEVLIQATRSGVRIILPDGSVTPDTIADLARRLGTAPALRGAAVSLTPAGSLQPDDLTALESLLIGQHQAACVEVVRAAAIEAPTPRATSPAPLRSPVRAPSPRPTEVAGDSLLVRRTLRSGQRIRFAGNVIVLGDVNPGAEIVAGGDIVVMGTLRGVAHAGAAGDPDAIVAAFRLLPTQIRVGGVIGRSPDGAYERPDVPEVARVRDGVLVVERLQPTFGEIAAGDGHA